MKKKIDRELLKGIMEAAEVDGILINDPYSLRYYTGFRGGEGVAVLSRESYVLITDSRYTEAAGQESEFEVKPDKPWEKYPDRIFLLPKESRCS